jgi:GR25 family glycosyltransferase involved in LPS biosynthesis
MWQDAYDKGHPVAIFGEDDIMFSDDWLLKFKLTTDRLDCLNVEWDLLYLGRALQHGQEDIPYDKELVHPAFSYCTHAYALSRNGIRKILNMKYKDNIIPSDEFLTCMYTSHPREDIREIFNNNSFVALAYKDSECLITQIPKDVSGSDTEESDYATP